MAGATAGSTTWGGVAGHGRASRRGGSEVEWLSDSVAITRRLGSPDTTAQVHPAAFTDRDDARGRGSREPRCGSGG